MKSNYIISTLKKKQCPIDFECSGKENNYQKTKDIIRIAKVEVQAKVIDAGIKDSRLLNEISNIFDSLEEIYWLK